MHPSRVGCVVEALTSPPRFLPLRGACRLPPPAVHAPSPLAPSPPPRTRPRAAPSPPLPASRHPAARPALRALCCAPVHDHAPCGHTKNTAGMSPSRWIHLLSEGTAESRYTRPMRIGRDTQAGHLLHRLPQPRAGRVNVQLPQTDRGKSL
ncbi:Protein of unknown function [Gryllus bimaculatus]|nr:Protein of unknown function [Gryllus bimaculatus]